MPSDDLSFLISIRLVMQELFFVHLALVQKKRHVNIHSVQN